MVFVKCSSDFSTYVNIKNVNNISITVTQQKWFQRMSAESYPIKKC